MGRDPTGVWGSRASHARVTLTALRAFRKWKKTTVLQSIVFSSFICTLSYFRSFPSRKNEPLNQWYHLRREQNFHEPEYNWYNFSLCVYSINETLFVKKRNVVTSNKGPAGLWSYYGQSSRQRARHRGHKRHVSAWWMLSLNFRSFPSLPKAKVEFILNFSPSEIPDLGASKWRFPGSRFVITLNPASRHICYPESRPHFWIPDSGLWGPSV